MPENIQFTRPLITGSNERIERLSHIMDVLTRHSPVNLHSAIVVLAPRNVQRLWMHAERQVNTGRYFIYVDHLGLEDLIAKIDDQVIFIVDELAPGTRTLAFEQLKKLNMDLGHRMFLNVEVADPDKVSASTVSGSKAVPTPETTSLMDSIMKPTKLGPPKNG